MAITLRDGSRQEIGRVLRHRHTDYIDYYRNAHPHEFSGSGATPMLSLSAQAA
jgi:hypothetical protein